MLSGDALLQHMLTTDARRKKAKAFGASNSVMRAYMSKMVSISDKVTAHTESVLRLLRRFEDKYALTTDSGLIISNDAAWDDEIMRRIDELQRIYSNRVFVDIARKVAESFVSDSNRYNLNQCKKSFGFNALSEPRVQALIKRKTKENVNLITSIPQDHFDKIRAAVERSINAGSRYDAIADELRKIEGVTDYRAKFIAKDQTLKLNGHLTATRHLESGFVGFRWIDSQDERERASHRKIANAVTEWGQGVYMYSDLPTNERNEKIIPGQDFQCRCTAEPFTQDELDEMKERGR